MENMGKRKLCSHKATREGNSYTWHFVEVHFIYSLMVSGTYVCVHQEALGPKEKGPQTSTSTRPPPTFVVPGMLLDFRS